MSLQNILVQSIAILVLFFAFCIEILDCVIIGHSFTDNRVYFLLQLLLLLNHRTPFFGSSKGKYGKSRKGAKKTNNKFRSEIQQQVSTAYREVQKNRQYELQHQSTILFYCRMALIQTKQFFSL